MLISPLGDNALTVDLGNVISDELNRKAIALCQRITENPFPGFIETVPAYASATVFYDLLTVRKAFPDYATAFNAVAKYVHDAANNLSESVEIAARTIEIPVHLDQANALDLVTAAGAKDLSPDEFLDIFLSQTYRVYMLGFLPGFAYMGEVDERIAVPRKLSPRTHVPKGSVGIAGRQTGIYPQESPGGWQIIGRTDLELFDAHRDEPCLFRPGDEVRFVGQNLER
jgi:inhibitor of KinA